MKKLVNVRNSVIVVLCFTIICLGIGFIVLSLKIDEIKDTSNSYDLAFVEVSKISSVSGGSTEPQGNIKIEKSGMVLDMNFTLNNARDELVYNVTIQNKGSIPAEIIDIIESPGYANGDDKNSLLPVSISYSDASGKVLDPGDSTIVKINVVYNASTVKGVKKFNYKLGLLSKSA